MYYRDVNILKDDRTNVRYYSTYDSLPKEISVSEDDIYILTTAGDRLDLLADQYYGKGRAWRILAIANPGLGKGTLFVPEGIQMRIPQQVGDLLELL